MRADLRPTKSFVYHKAQCTCLCVPVVRLRGDLGPPAVSSGLLLSEDDCDDDLDARSGRLPPAPSSPTPGTDLHMRHMCAWHPPSPFLLPSSFARHLS